MIAATQALTRPTVTLADASRPALIANVWLTEAEESVAAMPAPPNPVLSTAAINVAPPPELQVAGVAVGALGEAEFAQDASDVQTLGELQGRYRTQINARVSRVLAELDSPHLRWPDCVVRVIQDPDGRVLDVDLDDCGIDEAAKDLISRAIHASSPLPTPPPGLAIGSYLTLDLSGT